MPYQFWPGWKRGLLLTRVPAFGLLPYTGAAVACEILGPERPWWLHWEGPTLMWAPLAAYAGTKGVRYVRNREHHRHVTEPIRAAAVNILRSRDIRVDIPRGLVRSECSADVGRLWLPMGWAGSDGDRENLADMLQEKLQSPVHAEFDMAGRTPSAKLTIPKQPPKSVPWGEAILRADSQRPYLGESANGPMYWDLGDDSPHLGVVGGSGSGKSELMAWVVAQFMRGGAGVVVFDPKGTSHAWLLRMPEVLYCTTGAGLHDTIMWMDAEMDRRAEANRESVASGGSDLDFPRLVAVLEERNSLQDKLRDHWARVRPAGAPQLSPAIRALDRLSSMGRTLCITVLLAAQATAQQDIGKKNNYGSWAIAGRMAANHYKNIGVAKPAIAGRPGRFAYVVAGHATVFQAAFPDLKKHSDRLMDWARSGDAPLDVKVMMRVVGEVAYPSSMPPSSEPVTDELTVTLREYSLMRPDVNVKRLNNDRDRNPEDFPAPVQRPAKGGWRYREEELGEFYRGRVG